MVDFSCSVNRDHVRSNSSSVVFLAIDLFEDQSTVVQPQRLNICLAIDCSGSMQGEKLEQAKQSSLILAKSLAPNDLISIVSFDSKVKVELGPTQAGEQDKIEKVIQSIRVGGATFLYGALKQAHKVVSKNSQSGVSRIVLLTDGIPTDNENTHDYVDRCNEIRKERITVSPIGIGDQYNEDLLLQISDAGGGEWLHVTDPHGQLPNFLREQVQDMKNTVVINPELKFELIPGSEIVDFYSVMPVLTKMDLPERQGNQCIIRLRDIVLGQNQKIILGIKLLPQQSGEYNLINLDCMGKTMNIPITFTDDPNLYNIEQDPNPRILLFTAKGQTLIKDGIDGNTIALDNAKTILKNIQDEAATKLLDPETTKIVGGFEDIKNKTVALGSASEEQKKKLKNDATIIKGR